jgi:hypothetical protein
MLNKQNRDKNKSKGPWGMKNFDFRYVRTGDTVVRDRFISAPSEETAVEQFNFIMEKEGFTVDIKSITELD